jgi:hypothetical protein
MKLSELKTGYFLRFGKQESFHLYLKELGITISEEFTICHIDSFYKDDLSVAGSSSVLPITEIYNFENRVGKLIPDKLLYKSDYLKEREKIIKDIKNNIDNLDSEEIEIIWIVRKLKI